MRDINEIYIALAVINGNHRHQDVIQKGYRHHEIRAQKVSPEPPSSLLGDAKSPHTATCEAPHRTKTRSFCATVPSTRVRRRDQDALDLCHCPAHTQVPLASTLAAMDPTHTAHALHKLPINHTQTSVTKRLRTEKFVLEHRQSRACRTQSERTKAAQCKACTTKGRSHKRFDGLVTSYCIACAKTYDEPWYAAYTAAMRCAACGIGRRVHTKHGDRTTTYCMMCA